MTLTEVQKNFTAWRETRRHSKEKIPDQLYSSGDCENMRPTIASSRRFIGELNFNNKSRSTFSSSKKLP